ncbi:sigma-54-dependent Fis family transcriptional regulator, partial [bacterium]|nr:sigma-54-dependent Fis family transcriptional regulator [bacterium]
MNAKILLIDDDKLILKLLKKELGDAGYEVKTAEGGADGFEKFKSGSYDLLITDYMMPDIDGIELMQKVKAIDPDFPVIVFTAYGTVKNATDALRMGAVDYIEKPLDKEELLFRIKNVLENRSLKGEVRKLKRKLSGSLYMNKIVIKSRQMKEIFDKIELIASTDASVLISGESGTGKEVVARAIHQLSPRDNSNLVTVNCAALTETLLESELFGHIKGSFTGAYRDKRGLFEEADKGTIFLDEIGEISQNIQVKLLRVLQNGEVRPVGSEKYFKVDTRIISATNRNLKEAVQDKKIREDLYYRLNVIPIFVPPLRERKEDIPALAQFFLKRYSKKINRNIDSFSNSVMERIINYNWPGNIRELEQCIRNVMIRNEYRPPVQKQPSDTKLNFTEEIMSGSLTADELLTKYCTLVYSQTGSYQETARRLGLDRRTVKAKIG